MTYSILLLCQVTAGLLKIIFLDIFFCTCKQFLKIDYGLTVLKCDKTR